MVTDEERKDTAAVFPALVARVVSNRDVVMNRGSSDGIQIGQRFQIYSLSKDAVKDPETGEALGNLEIVKGIGKAIHVQERISTLRSDQYEDVGRRTVTRRGGFAIFGDVQETYEPTKELVPFEDPQVGDKIRPI